jgi:hypothetical protein
MEWFICCGYYGSLMEMCITLREGDWWGVSTPLMEGGPRTWISSKSHGGDVPFFWGELSFSFVVLVCFTIECIKYRRKKKLGKNAPLWV